MKSLKLRNRPWSVGPDKAKSKKKTLTDNLKFYQPFRGLLYDELYTRVSYFIEQLLCIDSYEPREAARGLQCLRTPTITFPPILKAFASAALKVIFNTGILFTC